MRTFIQILVVFILSAMTSDAQSFKSEQMKNSRVKTAYSKYGATLSAELSEAGVPVGQLSILLVGFKLEQKLKVYIKKRSESKYRLFKDYDFCVLSGGLGPKRKEGDLQVPEGFYYVNWFNPNSNFHLSFKINYPNGSDMILSDKKSPGGEIFIHGNCVSIGCIPITDEGIEELYILALESKNNGQNKIPVYIFPCEMTPSNRYYLETFYSGNEEIISFWKNLSGGYEKFFGTFSELNYTIDSNGKYIFR